MKPRWYLLATTLLCCTAVRANPTTIFSNYDAQHPFDTNFGLSVNNAVGVSFVAPDPHVSGFVYGLESINFAGLISDTNANPVTVSVYDSSGGFPGSALVSLTTSLGLSAGEVTVTSSAHPALQPNQIYWIVLSNPFAFDVTWSAAGNGALGAATLGAQNWTFLESYTQGAVQVNAILVEAPEPATVLLLVAGLTGLAVCGRRSFSL